MDLTVGSIRTRLLCDVGRLGCCVRWTTYVRQLRRSRNPLGGHLDGFQVPGRILVRPFSVGGGRIVRQPPAGDQLNRAADAKSLHIKIEDKDRTATDRLKDLTAW